MKRHFLIQSILFIVGIVTLTAVLFACKKDKLTEPPINNSESASYDSKTNLIVERIKRFDNQLKDIKKGVYRSDVYVDVDSAIWNIESLFNTTYSFPEKNYVEKTIQELTFDVDTYNNMLSMNDISVLYDNIVTSVREAYRNDGFTSNKGLMSIFIEKEDVRSGGVSVKVVVVSGKTDYQHHEYEPILFGPFDKYACWYFGEYGGSCDDPTIMTDAAELLEDTINYIYGYKPENQIDRRNIYVNLQSVFLYGNEYKNPSGTDYYLFYKENCDIEELYLDANELNEYYYAEVDVILNIVPNDPKYSPSMPEDWIFMEVNIDGVSAYNDNGPAYMHNNYIFYGSKYSVKKDEFGTQKDLLYN